jgi:hypothetical protein
MALDPEEAKRLHEEMQKLEGKTWEDLAGWSLPDPDDK